MVACLIGPASINKLRDLSDRAFGGIRVGSLLELGSGAVDLSLPPWRGESAEGLREAERAVARAAATSAAESKSQSGDSYELLQPFFAYPSGAGGARGDVAVFSPIGTASELTLLWPLPGESSAFGVRTGGLDLLLDIINDESPGGLRSVLKGGDMVEDLSASLDFSSTSLRLLSVTLQLSPGTVEEIRTMASSADENDEGKNKGLATQRLAGVIGGLAHTVFTFMDSVEAEILTSLRHSWDALEREYYSKSSGGLDTLRASAGLSKSELKELDELVLQRQQPPAFPKRVSWNEEEQVSLTSRATELAKRNTYRHYYSIIDGATEGLGGTLASWPSVAPSDGTATTFARIWGEGTAYAEAEFRYPEADVSLEARALGLLKGLWLGMGPSDILYPPSRRVFQPLTALRVLRQLVPGTTIGILSTPLASLLSSNFNSDRLPPPSTSMKPWGSKSPLTLSFLEPIYSTRFGKLPLLPCIAQHLALLESDSVSAAPTPSLPPPNPFIPTYWDLVQHAPSVASSLKIPQIASRGAMGGKGSDPILLRGVKNVEGVNKTDGSFPTATLISKNLGEVRVWWTPFIHLPIPRLSLGIELLSAGSSNYDNNNFLRLLLVQLYVSVSRESSREFLSNPSRAGSFLGLRFNPTTGSIEAVGKCFHSPPGGPCTQFLRVALGKIFPVNFTPSFVADRLVRLVESIGDSDFQAQPYTQAFTAAALASREKQASGLDLVRAAAKLVGGENSEEKLGVRGANVWDNLRGLVAWVRGELLNAIEKGNGKMGGLNSRLVTQALETYTATFFAGVKSVEILFGGNVALTDASDNIFVDAILPFLTSLSQEARARLGIVDDRVAGDTPPPSPRPITLYPPLRKSPPLALRGENPENSNSAAVLVLNAVAPASFKNWRLWNAAIHVLGVLIREPAFDELRTKQALGYIASAGKKEVQGPCTHLSVPTKTQAPSVTVVTVLADNRLVNQELPVGSCSNPSLYVLVQGVVLSAEGFGDRLSLFLRDSFGAGFLPYNLTQSTLWSLASAAAATLEEPHRDDGEAFTRAWSEVVKKTYDWKRWEAEARALRALTVDDVTSVFNSVMESGRELKVLIQGAVHGQG